MRPLGRAKTLGYATLALLLTLVFSLPACKRRQSPSAQDHAQNGSTQTVTPSQALPKTSADKIPLRILYVGLTDTERQKDFVSFLSQNFGEVRTVDLYTFREEQTRNSDVVILDKDGIQWGSEGGRPLMDLRVSAQYARPTVSLGIPGAFWTDRMRLKTGYM